MSTTFLFPHIPKTAGSYLVESFRVLFGEKSVLHFNNQDELDLALSSGLDPLAARDYRLLAGHVDPAILAWVAPVNSRWITVLRDPVERALSNLAYLKAHALEHDLEDLQSDPKKAGLFFARTATFADILAAEEEAGVFVKDTFYNPYAMTFARGVFGKLADVRSHLADPDSDCVYGVVLSAVRRLATFEHLVDFSNVGAFMRQLAVDLDQDPNRVPSVKVNQNTAFPEGNRSDLLATNNTDVGHALAFLTQIDMIVYKLCMDLPNFRKER